MERLLTVRRIDKPTIQTTIKIDTVTHLYPHIGRSKAKKLDLVQTTISDRKLHLVYKTYAKTEYMHNITHSYFTIKNLHIPVPHTFRVTQDNKGNLITDLSEGDKNIVISANNITPYDIKKLYNERRETMEKFSRAKSLLTAKVLNQTFDKWAKKTAQARLYIQLDAWFLIIKPNGQYKVILGDFDGISLSRSKNLTHENRRHLEVFSDQMSLVQEYAKDPEKGHKKLIQLTED